MKNTSSILNVTNKLSNVKFTWDSAETDAMSIEL